MLAVRLFYIYFRCVGDTYWYRYRTYHKVRYLPVPTYRGTVKVLRPRIRNISDPYLILFVSMYRKVTRVENIKMVVVPVLDPIGVSDTRKMD